MKQEKWEGRAKQEHLYELLEKIDTFYCFDEIDSKKLTALKIAFEEMFVNVTKYAYPKKEDIQKNVTVTLEWLDGEARIQLTDHGIPYNPLCKADPDLSADVMRRPIGGLGIHMVKKMTDDLQYSCRNGENQITLIKKLISTIGKEGNNMKITEQTTTEKTIICLEGRLDTITAPQLEKHIEEHLEGYHRLILDMEKLEYISSAGLRVLLALQKVMTKQGSLELTHVNETNMEVFTMTGFADILTIVQ